LTEEEFEKYRLPGMAFNKVKKPFNLVHKKKIITPEEEKISLEDLSGDLENLTSAGVFSGDDEEDE
jgi:hypothetical protein